MAASKTSGRSTVDNDQTLNNTWDGTALEALLNEIKDKLVRHYVATSLADAVKKSKEELGAFVLCPNGILVNGMLVATPDQEITLSTSGNSVRLTVDGQNTDITVPFATKAAQDSDGLAFTNYAKGINSLVLGDNGDGTVTIKYTTIATNNSGSDFSRAADLGTFMTSAEIISRLNDLKNAQSQGMVFMGTIGSGGHITSFNSSVGGEDLTGTGFVMIGTEVSVKAGWTFRVTDAQTIAGQECEAGDMIIMVNDVTPGQQIVSTDFTVVQNNVDKATKSSLGLVQVGSNISVDSNGVISVPTMTSSTEGVAACGSGLKMETGHISANLGKGLKNVSNAITVEDPILSVTQGSGATSIGVKIGPEGNATGTSSVVLPFANGTNGGISQNNYTSTEKDLLEHLGDLGLKWGGHIGEWWTITDSKNGLTIYLYPSSYTLFMIGSSYSLARLEQTGSGSGVNAPWAVVEYDTDLQATGYWLQYSANQGVWVRVLASSITIAAGSDNFKYSGSSADSAFFSAKYSSKTASGITAEENLVVMVANDGMELDLNTLNHGDLLIFRSSSIHDYTIVRGGYEAWERQKLRGIEYGATKTSVWTGTQAQYDAITTKDANTIYLITDVAWYDQYTSLTQLITALNNNGVGVIRSISVGGTAIAPDAKKNVNIPIASTSQNGVVKTLASGDYNVAATADGTMTIVSGNENDVVVAEVMKAVYDKINARLIEIENALTWMSID